MKTESKITENEPLGLMAVIASCKLELKHLAPYLPYELKFETNHGFDTMATLSDDQINGDFEDYYDFEQVKPILRPLSDLTKEIEANGEKFIPMELLNKLAYKNIVGISDLEDLQSPLGINDCAFWQIEKLFEWHFDVFGLIKKGLAIDTNITDNV